MVASVAINSLFLHNFWSFTYHARQSLSLTRGTGCPRKKSLIKFFLDDFPTDVDYGPTANFVAEELVVCQRSSCYLFVGMTSWSKLVDTRNPRMLHSSAESEDRILLIGGSASNSTEWIPVDGSPSQPGPFEVRHGHAHCTVQVSSDLIVVIGGVDTWDLVTEYQLTGDATETVMTSLINGRRDHACGVYREAGGPQVRISW